MRSPVCTAALALTFAFFTASPALAQGEPPDSGAPAEPPGDAAELPVDPETPPAPAPPPAPAEKAPPPPAATDAPGPPPEPEDKDGARFRGGVSGAFGGLFGSKDALDYTGFLGGVSGHIGVQIIDLIGIYAVPHLSFGSVSFQLGPLGEVSEGWLNFSATGVVDFTFIDQIFVGVGGGFAAHAPTCTNCNGLTGGVLHARFGGYPLMGYGEDGIRRKGLMIAGDLRVNVLSDDFIDSLVMVQPMLSIGYEAY